MSEENKEVLIEETDAGKRREQQPAPKKSNKGWLIATAIVVILGIAAGLAVYFVQQKRNSDVYERTVSVATKVTDETMPEEDEEEIEDSDDIVISGDDAIGGDLEGAPEEAATIRTETTTDVEDDEDADEDDDKTSGKTTKKTTRRTTQWNAEDLQDAYENFWSEVSKWAR